MSSKSLWLRRDRRCINDQNSRMGDEFSEGTQGTESKEMTRMAFAQKRDLFERKTL